MVALRATTLRGRQFWVNPKCRSRAGFINWCQRRMASHRSGPCHYMVFYVKIHRYIEALSQVLKTKVFLPDSMLYDLQKENYRVLSRIMREISRMNVKRHWQSFLDRCQVLKRGIGVELRYLIFRFSKFKEFGSLVSRKQLERVLSGHVESSGPFRPVGPHKSLMAHCDPSDFVGATDVVTSS